MKGNFRYSIFGALFFIFMFPSVVIFDLDLAEELQRFEDYEIDELILPLLVLIACIAIDIVRRKERFHFKEAINRHQDQIARSTDSFRSLRTKLAKLRNTAVDSSAPTKLVSLCEEALNECKERIIETDTK